MRPAQFSKSGFAIDKPLPPLRPDSHIPHTRSSMPPTSNASRSRGASPYTSHYVPTRLASTSPDVDTAYVRSRLRNGQQIPTSPSTFGGPPKVQGTPSNQRPSQEPIKHTGLERGSHLRRRKPTGPRSSAPVASGSSTANRQPQPSQAQAFVASTGYKGTSVSPPIQGKRLPPVTPAPSLGATNSKPRSLSPRAAEKQPALPALPQGTTPLVRRRLHQPVPETPMASKKSSQPKPSTSSIPFPRPMSTPSVSQRPSRDRPISPGARSVFDTQREKVLRGQARPSTSQIPSDFQPRPYHTWSEREQFKKSQTSLPVTPVPFPKASVAVEPKHDTKTVWKMIDNLMDEVHVHMHRNAGKSGNRMTHPPMTARKLKDPNPPVALPFKESVKEPRKSTFNDRGRQDQIEQPQHEAEQAPLHWIRTPSRSASPSLERDDNLLYTTISRSASIASSDSIVINPTFFPPSLCDQPPIEFAGPFLPVDQLPARFQQLLKNAEEHQERKIRNARTEPVIVDPTPAVYHRDVAAALNVLRTEFQEEDWREVLSR